MRIDEQSLGHAPWPARATWVAELTSKRGVASGFVAAHERNGGMRAYLTY